MLGIRVVVLIAVFLSATVFTVALKAATPETVAVENSATVNTVVEAGKWATARLGNLPAGALLGIKVTANGAFGVLLIDARDVKNFPDVERPLFKAHASRSLKFSVVVPRAGAYYLVIDNRTGNARRDVTIDISAAAPKPAAIGGATPPGTQLRTKTLAADISVEAGKISMIRLRDTPADALLTVKLTTDGEIAVYLLSQSAADSSKPGNKALYRGTTESQTEFSLNIPNRGNYFLILDNRTGAVARKVHVSAKVAAGPPGKSAAPTAGAGTLQSAIANLKTKLRQAFVFEELQIDVAACGRANSFSGPRRVLICAEHIRKLQNQLGATDKIRDALLFTILHEVGHVLLRQWSYPFYANEEVADELATMLMVMFNEKKAARTQADYFAAIPPDPEAEKKKKIDDRHPLSVQRARNILRWLNDPNFVAKWQTVLVPHMQTQMLESLLRQPRPWTSIPLVEKEIATRK